MFGSFGPACQATSLTFVSAASIQNGIGNVLGLRKRLAAVRGTRTIGKKDLPLNGYAPKIEVNPETYEVRADGEHLTCEPATSLPMAQRYFLF